MCKPVNRMRIKQKMKPRLILMRWPFFLFRVVTNATHYPKCVTTIWFALRQNPIVIKKKKKGENAIFLAFPPDFYSFTVKLVHISHFPWLDRVKFTNILDTFTCTVPNTVLQRMNQFLL